VGTMTKFRSTQQILSSIWKFENVDISINPNPNYWVEKRKMTIEDVKVWEELEFVPGCFGIYVSWDPYAEFYLITFNQFLDNPTGIRIFSGEHAAEEVKKFTKKLGCDLSLNKILINDQSLL
jgi:hypothetical protein